MEEPAEQLERGQVGTGVDGVDQDEGKQYLVEFADLEGREYEIAYLAESELLPLHYQFTAAQEGRGLGSSRVALLTLRLKPPRNEGERFEDRSHGEDQVMKLWVY